MARKRLLRAFRSFLHSISRFFMDDPQLNRSPFSSTKPDRVPDPASTWASYVLDSDKLPISKSLKLWKVEFCKCSGGKDHEFIILYFCDDRKDPKVAIIVDRSMGSSSSRGGSRSSLPSVPGTPNTSSHDIAARSIRLPRALDRVFVAVDGSDTSAEQTALANQGPYGVSSTLKPSTEINPMDTSHIAILIRTISERWPQYDANAKQCYWFAKSVFRTIMSETQCEEQHGVDSDMRGKLSMVPFAMFRQKSVQGSPEVNDGSTVEERSNYPLKHFAYSPHQDPDPAKVLEAYKLALKSEKGIWEKRARELEKAKRNEVKANLFDEEKKKAELATQAAAAAEKIAAEERAAAAAAKQTAEEERAAAAAAKQTAAAAKQTAAAAKQTAEEERAAAAAAKKNEEIAKKQAEEERLKAEEAVKYAAELEEIVRALKAQVGVQEGI